MLVTEENRAACLELVAKGFHDLPFDEYRKSPGVNAHSLMDLRISPFYLKYRKEFPYEPSDALDFGTLIHCALLEPERFALEYCAEPLVLPPNCLRTGDEMKRVLRAAGIKNTGVKADMQARIVEAKLDFVFIEDVTAAHIKGRKMIDEKFRVPLERITKSIAQNKYMSGFLEKGLKEKTAFYIHPEFNMLCKIRPDLVFLHDDQHFMVDIKTTRHIELDSLAQDFSRRMYRMQTAFYMDGYRYVTGASLHSFFWLAIESLAPYDWRLAQITQRSYLSGQNLYRESMKLYLDCEMKQEWPGHPKFPVELDIPDYVAYREEALI